ncbi:uncharacterized protein LOC141848933 [Brevipalpus obovatus]|uniref:uncharacterized protein LOC141848933 n=1 Tax=Brevipalpus obovatus TaxID=246614 RepID=UPI003D9EDD25
MTSGIKCTLIVILLCAVAYVHSQEDEKCSKFQGRADRYFKKMLFVGREPKIPRNETAIISYCKQVRKGYNMVKRYQTCLKPFPSQILGLVLRGAKESMKYVCDDKSHRKEVINYLGCLRSNNLGKAYTMLERALNVLDYIGYNVTDGHQLLPYICCSYHFISDRVKRFMEKECPAKSAGAEKFIHGVINLAAKDIIDLGCARTPSLQNCEERQSEIMQRIKEARFSSSTSLEERSFVKPVLAIADRLSPPEDISKRLRS